ncbi:MAG TPA: hypothetical protein VIH99_03555 [Bdellovibrionota bacterium]|jgi:hypothetical protein
MRRIPAWVRENPMLPWGALFLALCLGVTQFGGTNARSRFAALRALTEGHTLAIDNYKDWTIDWSLSPNGHTYSNKAPGAVFLGLPFFALTEAVVLPLNAKKIDDKGRVPAPGYGQHLFLILCLQMIPYLLLVLWLANQLKEKGAGKNAVLFFTLASLFGNTAAIYMNCNFGHGLAALLFLAAYFFWSERRYVLAGLFVSWTLLTDYGIAFALPLFLAATVWRERSGKSLRQIATGALPAAIVWVWYHTAAFGSPFATAIRYSNPEQIDPPLGQFVIQGAFSLVPSFTVLLRLLFGPERGLLFTQPWVLGVFALPFLKIKGLPRGTSLLLVGSLSALLWFVAGVGGWHGGWCAGPRYLSAMIPAAALALAQNWDALPLWLRHALWPALLVALAFRLLVFPFSNLAPMTNLWIHYLQEFRGEHVGTSILRISMAAVFVLIALRWHKRRNGTIWYREKN